MRIQVTLWISGTLVKEVVYARDYSGAKQTALSRNPTAKIVSITALV